MTLAEVNCHEYIHVCDIVRNRLSSSAGSWTFHVMSRKANLYNSPWHCYSYWYDENEDRVYEKTEAVKLCLAQWSLYVEHYVGPKTVRFPAVPESPQADTTAVSQHSQFTKKWCSLFLTDTLWEFSRMVWIHCYPRLDSIWHAQTQDTLLIWPTAYSSPSHLTLSWASIH